jgi:hypothetical protein
MRAIAIGLGMLVITSCASHRAEPGDDALDEAPPGDLGEVPPEAPPAVVPDAPPDSTPAPGPAPTQGGLSLLVVDSVGEAFPRGVVLGAKEQVYVRITGTANALDRVNADYRFRVIDESGRVLSSDDDACRVVHVNARGRIDEVLAGVDSSGAACLHRSSIADNFSVVPQLVPFADAEVAIDGAMHYIVEVLPVGLEHPVLAAEFVVAAPRCER